MSNISGVVARVFVDDLDTAIPLYHQLATPTERSSNTSRPETSAK
jgi:hypothetical protein